MRGGIQILWLAMWFLPAGLQASSNAIATPQPASLPGVSAYQGGDYPQAAEVFAGAISNRLATGNFLNLGLAEWRLGHHGPAVLAWERSLWVDPYNAAALGNLRFARKAAQLDAPEYTWYEAASMWLPVNAWALLAGASLWLAVAMVTLPRVLRWRRANWHQALAAAGCALFLLSLPSLYGVHTRSRIGIVLEKDVELRLTPTRNAQTLMLMPSGQPARWERSRGDYRFIRTGYARGWIESSKLGMVCPD